MTNAASLSQLRAERDRFVALAFSWADVLLELAADGRIIYAAGALDALIGRSAASISGLPLADLVPPQQHTVLRDILMSARRHERLHNTSLSLIGARGEPIAMTLAGYHLAELNGHYFLSLRTTRQERRTSGFGRRVARDDESGLRENADFIQAVTQHLAETARNEDPRCSFLALPGYDKLRKRLTETVERELLTQIGSLLQEKSIESDFAARIGPDRYALLHDDDLDVGYLRAQIASLTRQADPKSEGVGVTSATIEMDAGGMSRDDVAQGLLRGINQFSASEPSSLADTELMTSISLLAQEAVSMLDELNELIASGQFGLWFQPVLDTRTGSIHHYESLARFPELPSGRTPLETITLAEETGLIVNFDLAMVEKVVEWMSKNLYTAVQGKSIIAINISGRSVNSLSFLASIDQIVKANPWINRRIVFEITEFTRMTDLRSANNFIQRLRNDGFFVCIDGFGSGAAHFSYLASLDVDMVKFDGAAIRDAMAAPKGRAFLRAVVDLCRELSVATVAEDIEEEAGLRFVRQCGVHYVQGYLFGQPDPHIQAFNTAAFRQLFAQRPGH
jgi:FOG: EAL domain